VIVPPGIWTGLKGLSRPFAIIANCCTHPHDPGRTTRLDPFDNHIPYDWAVRVH
jgi:dTDP-4-dehydrorhamnose 3,5-epimerase